MFLNTSWQPLSTFSKKKYWSKLTTILAILTTFVASKQFYKLKWPKKHQQAHGCHWDLQDKLVANHPVQVLSKSHHYCSKVRYWTNIYALQLFIETNDLIITSVWPNKNKESWPWQYCARRNWPHPIKSRIVSPDYVIHLLFHELYPTISHSWKHHMSRKQMEDQFSVMNTKICQYVRWNLKTASPKNWWLITILHTVTNQFDIIMIILN
jgi:hypothetical protein